MIYVVRQTLSHTAAALVAAALVASCETTVGTAPLSGRSPAVIADTGADRVIVQAYRAIGDRHLYDPDFRKMSAETYRGFASADPALSLQTSDKVFTVRHDGREVLSKTVPADVSDGRAWGSLVGDLFTASVGASPVLKQSDPQLLIKGAMSASLKLLDRNSRYADPEEARDSRFLRDGGGGIGITVERTEDMKIMIRAVQDGSPAGRGGLKAGDQILAIDGEPVADRPLADIVHKLRGTISVPVVLSVMRSTENRELSLSLRRARIIPTTVTYERRGDTALIQLSSFNTATTDALRHAIEKARMDIGRDLAGIIIDMRGNRGGLLDQAQSVAEVFIGDGTIFSTQGRHPDSQRTYRSSSRRTADVPVVILLNGNSASAAEIVAAALQDRGRAVVVGSTSYGKGTVQTVIRLPNEGELVLTWSRLLAPSGYTWNELGVLPNICTTKVADVSRLDPKAVDTNRAAYLRWHAERNPSAAEVANMRKICPPSEDTPQRDLEIADRLLRSPALYAHAVRLGSVEQAARP